MMSDGNLEFKVIHWNCNSIRNKKIEFFDFLLNNNIHVACLNETKLNNKIRFSHNQFKVFRLDHRDNTSKGGVAIVAHRSVECQVLSSFNTETIEAIGVQAKLQSGASIKLISAYFTGTAALHDYRAFRRDIRKLTLANSVVLGDLNAKHSYWHCQRENQAGKHLYDEMLRQNFEIHFPTQPTYYPGNGRIPSTLDIVLSSTPIQFEPIQICEDLGSDHLPIILKFLEAPSSQDFQTVKCYSKTDWNRFRTQLNRGINIKEYQFPTQFCTIDVDERICKLVETLNIAASNCTPTIRVQPQKPYFNAQIKQLVQQRRAINRSLQRTDHPLLKIMYRNVKHLIERLCNLRYNKVFQSYIEKFTPNVDNNKKVWHMVKVLRGKKVQLPFLKHQDTFLMTNEERAEALADHFSCNHNK